MGTVLKGIRPDPYKGPSVNPTRYGNEVALNVGKGGPGTGREVFKAGSQHGLTTRANSPRSNRSFDD
jgi:hypothetical protein